MGLSYSSANRLYLVNIAAPCPLVVCLAEHQQGNAVMAIFLSILIALILMISIWAIRSRAPDLGEFDLPVCELMKAASDVSPEHEQVVEKLRQFHLDSKKDIKSQREQMDNFFTREVPCRVTPVDVDGIPAEWVVDKNADPDCRLLYLHGGGFRIGSPKSHRYITSELSRMTGASVLAIDYRMQPEFKTIDCHLDTHNAYRWILDHGPDITTPVRDLFVAGDSAGGNLTLAVLAWARNNRLHPANGAVAFAPLTDTTMSSPSWKSNLETDPFLGPAMKPLFKIPRVIIALITRLGTGVPLNDPQIAPLLGELSNLPDTLIQVSAAEMLFDDGHRYANKANLSGSHVSLQVWPKMVHVFQGFAPELPEANDALVLATDFIKARMTAPMAVSKAGLTPTGFPMGL